MGDVALFWRKHYRVQGRENNALVRINRHNIFRITG